MGLGVFLLQEIKRFGEDLFQTFYAWVFQFVGEMNIVAPGYVRDAYAEYLQQAIDDVLET